jgi:DNA-binding NarL/FixJ family response regulator
MKPPDKPIRVLLVDDHPTVLWGLKELIDASEPRMQVVGTAKNCDEALSKANQLTPDLILLDLDLVGGNAADILPALLANGISRALILTGSRDQAALDAAVSRGARGVLHKSASTEQILLAMEKVHQGELWLDREMLGRVFTEFIHQIASPKPDTASVRNASLTAKERKIVHAMVEDSGASTTALAARLFIAEHTLRNHLTSIYHKLDVSSRLELYVYAVKHGLGKD